MTNEVIVVEFMCIFLLKDKAIDKNAWVVDMKVETAKMLMLGETLNMSLILFLVD